MSLRLKLNSAFWITLLYVALSEVFSNAEALLKAANWFRSFSLSTLIYLRVFLRYLSFLAIVLLAKVPISRVAIALISVSVVFYLAQGYFVAIAAAHLFTVLKLPSNSLTHSNSPSSNPEPTVNES